MKTFEDLSQRRRNYVAAAQDNGFEDGLRNLLADLYPDNAHFIYELLQNAEDAGASEVTFELQLDGLKVEHDGKRLFDLRDIASITGIGQSTKPDDETKIGKFGVGFKAVFAYTQTPVIHSGEYSFAIQNLFMPVRIPADVRPGKTTFWFPFDRPDKPAELAFKEVETALRDIASSTLLFLNSIQMIGCFLHGGDERLLQRRQLDDHIIEIDSVHEEEGATFWYRVTSDVAFGGKSLPIAAAFALEPSATEQKSKKRFKVRPIDGQVFIYFPAVKETSGLKFHVHAPFASTVARDSIRDDPGNVELVEGLAALIADSLPKMRDNGLLTNGLLEALPNISDDLPQRFAVVGYQVVTAFENQELTPKIGGGYAPSITLLRADPHVRSALTIEEAQQLVEMDEEVEEARFAGWLPSRDGRAGALLDSLSAIPLEKEEITAIFNCVSRAYEQGKPEDAGNGLPASEIPSLLSTWNAWIGGKTTEWLRNFYVMLEEYTGLTRSRNQLVAKEAREYVNALISAPLFPVQSEGGVQYVSGRKAYLPLVPGLRSNGLIVDEVAAFESTEHEQILRAFYEILLVRPWNAAAQLDQNFDSYAGSPAQISDQHVIDLKTLTSLIDKKTVSPVSFRNKRIFLAVRPNGRRFWARPSQLFLDEPFISTGLASLYESEEYQATPDAFLYQLYPLAPEYLETKIDICTLVSELGASTGLHISEARVDRNPSFRFGWVDRETHLRRASDWDIPNFELITSVGNETLLCDLWRVVTTKSERYADAFYRANGSATQHVMSSQLLNRLQSTPWILDRDGNLRLPEEITELEMSEKLHVPTSSVILEKAGFGRQATKDAVQQQKHEEFARSYGIESLDDLRRFSVALKSNPEGLKSMLEALEAEQLFPEAASSAPAHRAKRAGEVAAGASYRRYEQRVRSVYVQLPGHLSAAKGYLESHYTNAESIMICQICGNSMPFKIKGQNYFEAVQFVKNSKRDLRENRLALCPVCAAKYRHARETSPDELREDLLTLEIGDRGSVSVDVVLAGESAKVRFVGKHAIDLQAALEATMSDSPQELDDGS